MVKEDVLRDAEEVEIINNVLELMRQKTMNPDLTAEVIRSISPQICQ